MKTKKFVKRKGARMISFTMDYYIDAVKMGRVVIALGYLAKLISV